MLDGTLVVQLKMMGQYGVDDQMPHNSWVMEMQILQIDLLLYR